MNQSSYKTVIIGAGNVGTHLAHELFHKQIPVIQVISRTEQSASTLAQSIHCEYSTNITHIRPDANMIIVCVPDSEIASVLNQLPSTDAIVVHTSGGVGMDVFPNHLKNIGCLYFLQSFSKSVAINFQELYAFVEANSNETLQYIISFAQKITSHVQRMTSQQRAILHVCAVMVNNFPNHLFTLADDLMHKNNLSFDAFLPLIQATTKKIETIAPLEAQTGPARRGDMLVIEKHQNILQEEKNILEIYNILTNSILKTYNK